MKQKMYGNIHLSENETYKPGDKCISFICECVYKYIKTKLQ